mgnify:CR=1 FL=1
MENETNNSDLSMVNKVNAELLENKRSLEKEVEQMTQIRDRLLEENRRFKDFFNNFFELLSETNAITALTDDIKKQVEDDLDIDEKVKEVVRDSLTVSISDAYCSVDI